MEKIKNIEIDSNKLSKVLYTITLILILLRKYTISMFRDGLVPNIILTILFYSSILLLFIQFIIRKKHNIIEIVLFLISSFLYILTKDGSILVIILMSIAILDIEDKYVVKSYLISTCIFITLSIILGTFATDLTQTINMHYRLVGSEYVPRQTFGFGNPNTTFLFILPIYASYIYLRFDEYNIYDRLCLLITTFFIYSKTMSRTGMMTIIAVLIIVEILKFIDLKKHKVIANIFRMAPILLLALSILIGTSFASNNALNSVLSSRPRHWNAYLIKSGNLLTLFGNSYDSNMKIVHPLDSSYIYILATLGIVSTLLMMYILYNGIDLFIKSDEKKYLAIVIIFIICGFAENIMFEVGYNFTIILLGKYVILKDQNYYSKLEILKIMPKSILNKFRRKKLC